ncbi:MAG: cob(I)yrinic acid a,c-diamide adenosyltransferase, partial [Candidatus Anstonellaceae archaeon]
MPRKQGLIHVLTGDGNGKTTSAVGIAIRAAGRGLKVGFVQFLKGGLSGEVPGMRKLGIEVISGTKHCPKNQEHAKFLSKNGHVFFCKDCFAINEQDTKL